MIPPAYVDHFSKNYVPRSPDKPRTIGIELEFPIVDAAGRAVGYDTTEKLFATLADQGWQVTTDGGTGLPIEVHRAVEVAHQGRFGYLTDTIGTDVGHATIEVALSPAQDLPALERHWQRLKPLLVDFFRGEDCHILGYGIQPFSSPHRSLTAPKGRYQIIEWDSANLFIDQRHGSDAVAHTLTAANQCHVDVYRDEAILAVNVANGLAPLFSALTCNSPVWLGAADPQWLDLREVFWDLSCTNRLDQVGIPDPFADLTDYVERIAAFRPLMVQRGAEFIQILECRTFAEFLARGTGIRGRTASGTPVTIDTELDDIRFHHGFAWWNARLSSSYGTLEMRPCSQQPPNATMAVAALTLGLVENLAAARQLYARYDHGDWRRLRHDVLRHGLGAEINGDPVLPLAVELLDLAGEGLAQRGLGEESYLNVLRERTDRKTTIAEEVKAIFDPTNLKAFLDLVEIR